MTDTFLSLSTTEDYLATDKDGAVKKGLIVQFKEEIDRLKSPDNLDLSPEDFEQKESLIKAMEESIKLIEMTWAKYHLAGKQVH